MNSGITCAIAYGFHRIYDFSRYLLLNAKSVFFSAGNYSQIDRDKTLTTSMQDILFSNTNKMKKRCYDHNIFTTNSK